MADAGRVDARRGTADRHGERRDEFRSFVATHVVPFAERWEKDERLPDAIVVRMAQRGYLGATIPRERDGRGWDVVTFGLLNEAFGRGSAALTGVITVQAMVAMSLLKWGTRPQKEEWIPRLARGEAIGAFAMTEPGSGSALHALRTELRPIGDDYVLEGSKTWISCAQLASVFLVFAMCDGRSIACLVPRESGGLHVEPIRDLMGFRAAGLAEITFDRVRVPAANVVGKAGFALSHVAPVGLHYGRISTACSALGLLRGCVEESAGWASERRVGGRAVGDFGMVRSMIASMGTDLEAADHLCRAACLAEDERRPDAFEKAVMAKYFTSRAAVHAASDAVQIRGAAGCHASSATSRFYRDSKIMEIIEGTTQIHEDILAGLLVGRAAGMEALPTTG